MAKGIISMIDKSKLSANGEARCFLDDSSKDTEGTSKSDADGYNQGVPRMVVIIQK